MHRNDESTNDTRSDPLTGHEYDGIAECDNPLPTWWRRIFWATFFFSVGYYVHYQLTGNGTSAEEGYAVEMQEYREKLAAASLGQKIDEEGLTRLMTDPAMMKDAASIYRSRCIQCHADRGQGNIGPNLTDDHWLNPAASLMDLHEVIANGRPQRGMPAWSKFLRPVEVAQLSAFIGTLRNTNVPGRPPQGTRIVVLTAPPEPAAPQHPVATVPASEGGVR